MGIEATAKLAWAGLLNLGIRDTDIASIAGVGRRSCAFLGLNNFVEDRVHICSGDIGRISSIRSKSGDKFGVV